MIFADFSEDGMIIIWAQSTTPAASSYGSDLSPDEIQYEKEYWKARITFRHDMLLE
jgi:chromatin assembly factor 1 subunit B